METVNVISLVNVLIALATLGVLIWAVRTNQTQVRANQAQQQAQERDVGLTAWRDMLQHGLLALKGLFAAHPEAFEQQMMLNPTIRTFIPPYMTVPTFLTFTRAYWLLAYMHTVLEKELGLSDVKRAAV